MRWINLLHFYQPANVDSFVIREAFEKSYSRLIRLMEENKNLKMTWNISGCLLLRLQEEGKQGFIDSLKKLIKRGQIELVSSAAYHAFLPLITENEVILQIKENEKILFDVLNIKEVPRGFFLPEMAYSKEVAKIIYKLGYKWIILDEIAAYKYPGLDKNKFYIDKNSGLKVVFRNRKISTSYPPLKMLETKKSENNNEIFITATDAELYGLRHEDPTGDMEQVSKRKDIITETVSVFISKLEKSKIGGEKINIGASSWDTSVDEIKNKEPYKLWSNKKNPIHQELWKLATLILSLDKKYKKDANYYWYRWHLVRGIASCTFWWASAYDFSQVFGPNAWSPDVVDRGLEDMVRAIRSIDNESSKKYKLKAENNYLQIKKLIWEEHWKKHWHKKLI